MSGKIEYDVDGDNKYGLFEVANTAKYLNGLTSIGYSAGKFS